MLSSLLEVMDVFWVKTESDKACLSLLFHMHTQYCVTKDKYHISFFSCCSYTLIQNFLNHKNRQYYMRGKKPC